MRTTYWISRMAVVALLAASPWLYGPRAAEKGAALEIGARPPKSSVKMQNVDGSTLSIADVADKKGTLVIFSCNACPWVKAWEDRIASLGNTYRERQIGVIVINANDPAESPEDGFDVMKQRAEERGFAFPYVVDATSEVAAAFGATRTPEVFLFDADQKLVYHGAIDDNAKEPEKVEEHYLRDALEALLAGEPVSVRQTKAIGCSIKFRQSA
jgi:peroxiredoxin